MGVLRIRGQFGFPRHALCRSMYKLQYLHSNNSARTTEIYLKELIRETSQRQRATDEIDPTECGGERDLLRRN